MRKHETSRRRRHTRISNLIGIGPPRRDALGAPSRTRRGFLGHLLLALTLSFGFAGGEAGAQIFGMSEEQEIAIGREASKEVEKQEPVLHDRTVTAYVDDLGQRLVRTSGRSDIPYEFKVIDEDEVNAFALPGGFIYLNRGLIETAETESQLASVLAHEIAHVVGRHSVDQMQKAQLTGLGLGILGMILGDEGTASDVAGVAAQMVATGAFMKYSREHEEEADRLGARAMYEAGYDPRGMVELFEKLQSLREREPNLLDKFFSSHPSPGDRIANISRLIQGFPERGGLTRDSEEFQRIRGRLR